jgi:hypothetical protein
MNSMIRRKLAMVSRVRDFCRANPSDTPGYVEALAQLEERLGRAEGLATQQDTGVLTQRGSTKGKAVLRKTIRENHLRHLVRIARGAATVNPELPKRFRLPFKTANGQTFLAAARAMLEQATANKDLFIQDGMPATFLDDLAGVLAEYDQALNGQHQGAALHIGAVAELPELTKELFQLVKRFDGLNLLRFQDNPEKRAAWLAARDMSWPGLGEIIEPAAPTTPPVSPSQDVKPAA